MKEELGSLAAPAQALLARGGAVTLATLRPGGGPFASYVVTAPDADGAPLLLLSRLAAHTRNLEHDARASLLFVGEADSDDAMTAPRLTLTGTCVTYAEPEARRRYLARHPSAARYAGFADFSLYRFEIGSGHLVAGFGRIVSLTVEELLPARHGG